MLTHINLQYYGDMIRNAVNTVLKTGKVSVSFLILENFESKIIFFSGNEQRYGSKICERRENFITKKSTNWPIQKFYPSLKTQNMNFHKN